MTFSIVHFIPWKHTATFIPLFSALNTVCLLLHINLSKIPGATHSLPVNPFLFFFFGMAKLAFFLALSQATLLYSLPTRVTKREVEVIEERAVTISPNNDIITSYRPIGSSLQVATATVSPSITGVSKSIATHSFVA